MKKPKRLFKKHVYSTGNLTLDRKILDLLAKAGISKDDHFVKDIIITALKLRSDGIEQGDVKMLTTAVKELRYALKTFLPFEHVRKVAIFGSARLPNTDRDYRLAYEFARLIADKGWMVITGAASGIMSAGNEGAGRANSFGVNIQLPFEQEANHVMTDDQKLVNFKYFFTRKLIFMRESNATVLFPGGFGTHDEGFETLTLVQTGKTDPRPIVCIDHPGSRYWKMWKAFSQQQLAKKKLIDPEDINLIHFTHDAHDAVKYITHFYANYHSSRYIGPRFVVRLKRPLTPSELGRINKNFKDILIKGKFEQQAEPFEEEKDELHTHGLTRLAFYFTRRHFARLGALIHEINRQ